MVKAKRFQLVTSVTPAGGLGAGARLYFQDQPQLRTQLNQLVVIKAVEFFDVNACSVSPSGGAVATDAQMKNAFLVLNIKGTEQLQYIPLVALKRVNTTFDLVGGNLASFVMELFELADQFEIDWTKSYIQFGAAVPAAVNFLFGVYYEYVPVSN